MSQSPDPSTISAPTPAEVIARLVADPRMRRIERDHTVLGGMLIAASLWARSWPETASVAFGWGLVAASLWMWKRVALHIFSGGASSSRLVTAQVIAKTGLVIAILASIVPSAPLAPGPLMIGILVFPVVLVIEMVRSTSPAALVAASSRGTDR